MIDTSNWKEFRVGDLFDMSLSKDDIQPKSIVEGDIPLISSGKTNNGIVAYIQDDKATIQKANTITVDMFGKAFYQVNPYYCVSHGRVNILTPKFDINEYIGLFVISVIEKVSNEKYEFDSMCTGKKLTEDIVSLPAKPDGQPDWDYMESYMRAVMEESEKSLENLMKADNTKHLIDVSGWGKFSCKELFECKNTGNILARDVINGSGDTPYVTASGYNNGVVAYIDASNYEIIKGHCILVGGKTFTITYQKDDFVSNDSHNFTIRVKDYDISDLDYLYLVSMIYTYFGQKYSWNDAVTKDKLFNESIPLPITSTGEPDWQYMESYMKQIMDKSEQIISDLQVGA